MAIPTGLATMAGMLRTGINPIHRSSRPKSYRAPLSRTLEFSAKYVDGLSKRHKKHKSFKGFKSKNPKKKL